MRALVLLLALAACHRAPADLVFVSNEDSNDVSVIDAREGRVVRTIAVGQRPRGLRVSPDGTVLYVAVSGSTKSPPGAPDKPLDAPRNDAADGIAVIDIERGQLVRTLPSGRDPESFDISPDGATLYVSNEETAELAIVDVQSAQVLAKVGVGAEPEGVTVSPDGKSVYVTSEAAAEVTVVDVASRSVRAHVKTGQRPRAVAFTGARALVTTELGGGVDFVDTDSTTRTTTVKTGADKPRPMGIALSPDGSRAFVGNGRDGSVAVVDVGAERLDRTVPKVGERVWGIAFGSDGRKVYAAALPDLAVLDGSSGELLARIPVGKGPWGVAVRRAR